jgi:hypothetical protein
MKTKFNGNHFFFSFFEKLQELTKFQLISFVAVPKFKRLNLLRMSKPMRPVVFGIRGSLYYNAQVTIFKN